MALCISTKVFSIKAFEVGLIFATFFIIPTVFSAPVQQIDSKIMNPCGYRVRHGRSAKERHIESQLNYTKQEYKNSLQQLFKLYDSKPSDLDTLTIALPYVLPKNVVAKKKRNYESVQKYIKTFDILANQEISSFPVSGNFSTSERKRLFNTLTDSLIRLLCQMYDEQKKNRPMTVKKNITNFGNDIGTPRDFTELSGQDQLVLKEFGKFLKKFDEFLKKTRKNPKNRQRKRKGVKKTKPGAEQKRKVKKNLNKRKNLKKIVS